MEGLSVYLAQWATLTLVIFIASVSPGPDFVMAVKNSIAHSRRAGVLTACGFGLSILVHACYTVLGFAALIAGSALLFDLIKYAGAGYLAYVGFQALRSQGMGRAAVDQALAQEKKSELSDLAALRSGFLTNLLNPKASLFFLAVFSQIVRPDTPLAWQALYGATCAAVVCGWFCLVAFVLTHKKVRNAFLKGAKWIDRGCGLLLIGLAAKVAFSSK